jgi:hypothetical protein
MKIPSRVRNTEGANNKRTKRSSPGRDTPIIIAIVQSVKYDCKWLRVSFPLPQCRRLLSYPAAFFIGVYMPSKSAKQKRFMAAAANNPKFAKEAGIPQKVAKEYHKEDKKKSKKC